MNNLATAKKPGWRGSEDLWLDAAYALLAESGVEAVKVMPLAKSLNLSRTSFYWHFEDRNALLVALVSRWQKKNTGNLVAQTELYTETITEAMLNLFDCWIHPALFDAQVDLAIRNWANQDNELLATLLNADQQRMSAIARMYTRFDYTAAQADIRAHTVYYTQVGYISMRVTEPFSTRFDKMPNYVELFTDWYPTQSEISRFKARHQSEARFTM